MKRIDGQIWIDRKAPYRLKYHINGIDYVVQVAASYQLADGEEYMPAGTVVKAVGNNSVARAIFPDDLNKVLGVTLNSSDPDTPGGAEEIAVAQDGYLIIEEKDLPLVMPLESDRDITQNGWNDETSGVGANVYWFIGRTVNNGGTYTYEESDRDGFRGCLTFTTPSGYKYKNVDTSDESMNVYYDNLPMIGSVANYELNGNQIKTLYINLNFSKFDTSLEWSWPGFHTSNCGKITKTDPVKNKLRIRHGLFADNNQNNQMSNHVEILASEDPPTDNSDYTIATHAINVFTGDDRYTEIDLFTPEDLYYRIIGQVHYNLDRNHTTEGGN